MVGGSEQSDAKVSALERLAVHGQIYRPVNP